MDLPTCPACGQSVLDDDATECPFCGSSMSASPSGKASATKKNPPTKPAAKSDAKSAAASATKSSTKPAAKPTSTSETAPVAKSETAAATPPRRPGLFDEKEVDPEEIIATDQEALKRAFPVRAQPAKGCSYKVVCPMCEAPGYIPIKGAGHDVKCHNPHCLVPIFTAPAIEKKEVAPEPESSGLATWMYGVIAAVVIGLGIGGYFLFFKRSPTNPAGPPIVITPPNNGADPIDKGEEVPVPDAGGVKAPPVVNLPRLAMDLASAARRVPRTRKPFARRWSAEAAARMGKVSEAKGQLRKLEEVGRTVFFLKVPPLSEIGWRQRQQKEGDAEVAKTLDEALQAAGKLRPQGRFRYEAAMPLASLLVAANRDQEALNIIRQHHTSSMTGRVAADVFVAMQATDYDFDRATEVAPIGGWHAPQFSAIPAALIARGEPDAALRWVQLAESPEKLAEATMVWAEFLVQTSTNAELPDRLGAIDAAIKNLSPAGRALVRSRTAASLLKREQTETADVWATAARAELAGIPVPPPMELQNKKAVINFRAPELGEIRTAARATAELARLEIALGNTEEGIATVDRGLQFCRAMAPAPAVVQGWLNDINQSGMAAIEARIKAELSLPNNDIARLQAADYVRNCKVLSELANERFELQVATIEAAIAPNSLESVVTFITDKEKIPAKEAFADTAIAWMLVEQFQAAGEKDRAKQVYNQMAKDSESNAWQLPQIRNMIADGEFQDAADQINRLSGTADQRDHAVHLLLSRLVRQGEWKSALSVAHLLSDAGLSEEALLLVSAQASSMGNGTEILKFADQLQPQYTEKVSIYTGILLGSTVKKPTPPSPPVPPEGDDAAAAVQ